MKHLYYLRPAGVLSLPWPCEADSAQLAVNTAYRSLKPTTATFEVWTAAEWHRMVEPTVLDVYADVEI